MTKLTWLTAGLLAVGILAACGPPEGRPGGTMQAPELGISLQAPAGWQVQSTDHAMATKGDSTGIIFEEPLHGRAFGTLVEELTMTIESETRLVSRTDETISGHEAVIAELEFPTAGSKALKAYIHKPPNLIEVSFVTPIEEFEAEEAALRAAIDSIEIR